MMNEQIYKKLEHYVIENDFENLTNSITQGSNVNARNEKGRTVLFEAILSNNKKMTEFLLNNGADPNIKDKDGWTPLHYAAQDNLLDIALVLLENGADVNAKDSNGNTVILRAVFSSRGRGDMINLLKQYNADETLKNNHDISAIDLAKNIGNYNIKKFFSN